MGGGFDLLDTWDLPIKGGYFSKGRLYPLCLPWEGCSICVSVYFAQDYDLFFKINFIDCVFNFSISSVAYPEGFRRRYTGFGAQTMCRNY